MARADRLERLTDLVLVLLSATHPLTLDAIAEEVPGYPPEHDARRQAFERDKRLLRDEGIPVATEQVEGQEQFGYRIHPEAFYLPDLELEPDEQAALHLAVAGVNLGDPSGGHALLKLGATGLVESRPIAALIPPAALLPLFEGMRSRAEVTFTYRSEKRHVSPVSLAFRAGRWYLVGFDRQRGAVRTFRVDRIEGQPEAGEPGSGERPDDADVRNAVPDDPWRAGEGDPADVLLWVDPIESARLVGEVGEQAVVESRTDGSVVLRLGSTGEETFRSWVLGLLDHVEVLQPPSVRGSIVTWLEEVISGSSTVRETLQPVAVDETTSAPRGDAAGLRAGGPARHDASFRLRRLLAIVGWLAKEGEATIEEVARRFGLPEEELVRELELAACCGLPPYSPDVLMEIVVTDEMVSALLPAEMARPRRLTSAEGLALLAAGRTILAVPGADENGALDRALVKLAAVLGERGSLTVALDTPPFLAAVQQATTSRQRIEIEYHSASSDETTRRLVDPLQVLNLDGHWYLDGYCHAAGSHRRFRVDRIRSLRATSEETGAPLPAHTDVVGPDSFIPGPEAITVRLGIDDSAAWIIDSIPVLDVRDLGGGIRQVTLAVGGTAWLERLLLQLGPHARVLEPSDLADLGATAAARVLHRYRTAG